jgi:hypothetical protein
MMRTGEVGADDERGTLNPISRERVRAATALVRYALVRFGRALRD